MNKILDVVEDIKNKLTDNEYKTIMDSLMEVHKIENKNINIKGFVFKCFTLMNWLDSKLIFQLDTDTHKQIKKTN
jgi:flagellar motor switch protein FliG